MSSGQIADENCVLVKVEREVIDKLDELICEGRGDDEYKQLFTTAYVLTTGPPNGPLLFYRLSYVSVCRLSASFVVVCNAAGRRARGRSGGRHGTARHGGPVRLRLVRATPCLFHRISGKVMSCCFCCSVSER